MLRRLTFRGVWSRYVYVTNKVRICVDSYFLHSPQLEAQQARNKSSLNDLENAVKALEKNMQENGDVEKSNVAKLEASVQGLLERLDKVQGN
jgi:hypothetical protein